MRVHRHDRNQVLICSSSGNNNNIIIDAAAAAAAPPPPYYIIICLSSLFYALVRWWLVTGVCMRCVYISFIVFHADNLSLHEYNNKFLRLHYQTMHRSRQLSRSIRVLEVRCTGHMRCAQRRASDEWNQCNPVTVCVVVNDGHESIGFVAVDNDWAWGKRYTMLI